jgi:hypothetical protein
MEVKFEKDNYDEEFETSFHPASFYFTNLEIKYWDVEEMLGC